MNYIHQGYRLIGVAFVVCAFLVVALSGCTVSPTVSSGDRTVNPDDSSDPSPSSEYGTVRLFFERIPADAVTLRVESGYTDDMLHFEELNEIEVSASDPYVDIANLVASELWIVLTVLDANGETLLAPGQIVTMPIIGEQVEARIGPTNYVLVLSADPTTIGVNSQTSVITAELKSVASNGDVIPAGSAIVNKRVRFETDFGTLAGASSVMVDSEGVATIGLSGSEQGKATVTAYVDIDGKEATETVIIGPRMQGRVVVTASADQAQIGSALSFTVHLDDPPPGQYTVSYEWSCVPDAQADSFYDNRMTVKTSESPYTGLEISPDGSSASLTLGDTVGFVRVGCTATIEGDVDFILEQGSDMQRVDVVHEGDDVPVEIIYYEEEHASSWFMAVYVVAAWEAEAGVDWLATIRSDYHTGSDVAQWYFDGAPATVFAAMADDPDGPFDGMAVVELDKAYVNINKSEEGSYAEWKVWAEAKEEEFVERYEGIHVTVSEAVSP